MASSYFKDIVSGSVNETKVDEKNIEMLGDNDVINSIKRMYSKFKKNRLIKRI